MKVLVMVVTVCVVVTGCSSLSSDQNTMLGSLTGGLLGGVAGTKLDTHLGTGGMATTFLTTTGAMLGGALAQYLTKQDQANIVGVLNDTREIQSVAWCSDTRQISRSVNSVQCGNRNKIVETPSVAIKNNQGETCRAAKTEVVKPTGEVETVTQNLCLAQNGGWYEKTA